MTGVVSTAVTGGLLACAIAFAWRITWGTSDDPKMMLLNHLMRHPAHWHRHAAHVR